MYTYKLISSSLPVGYKEKVMTAEAIQKAALKSQKRKQLADEKREKDKVI
jgi:INO80 complex subunit B